MVFFMARDRSRSAEMKLEGEIREFVRRDFGLLRQPQERPRPEDFAPRRRRQGPDLASGNAGSLLQRMRDASLKEVADLIVELQTQREKLLSESSRVQREIIEFAKMSQSTMQSTKIIAESLTHWNRIGDAPGAKSLAENADRKKRRQSDGESSLRAGEDTEARQSTEATAAVPENLSSEDSPTVPTSVCVEC
jgi:hypothetical protein